MKKVVIMLMGVLLVTQPPIAYANHVAEREIVCLAKNIYFEARNETTYSKHAIMAVTLKRVRMKKYPNTVCQVVYQAVRKNGRIVLNKCQFSWYCDGRHDTPRGKAWKSSYRIAARYYKKPRRDNTRGATHYHAYYVKPYWAKNRKRMKYLKKIGSHLFYKEICFKKKGNRYYGSFCK